MCGGVWCIHPGEELRALLLPHRTRRDSSGKLRLNSVVNGVPLLDLPGAHRVCHDLDGAAGPGPGIQAGRSLVQDIADCCVRIFILIYKFKCSVSLFSPSFSFLFLLPGVGHSGRKLVSYLHVFIEAGRKRPGSAGMGAICLTSRFEHFFLHSRMCLFDNDTRSLGEWSSCDQQDPVV